MNSDSGIELVNSHSEVSIEISPNDLAPKRVSFAMFTFMVYVAVCSGPYGIEDAVGVGYPLICFLGLILVPLLYSAPCALMAAELGSAMPDNAGYIKWVHKGMGPFFAFFEGYFSLISTTVDIALYPVMICDYIGGLFGVDLGRSWYGIGFRFVLILISFFLNFFGIEIIGIGAIIMTIIILLPFPIMMVYSLPHFSISALIATPPSLGGRNWSLFLSVLLWNYSGFDTLSTVTGELKSPKKIPQSLFLALIMGIVTYLLPLSVLIPASTNYGNWTEGYFPIIAEDLAGPWLRIFVIICQGVSSFSLLIEYTCTTAYMLAEWTNAEYLDIPFLTVRSKYQTPWVSLLVIATLTFATTFLGSFEMILSVDSIMFNFALSFEFISFIILRYTHPDMARPFKVPGGNFVAIVMSVPPLILCTIVVVAGCLWSYMITIIFVIITLLGIPLYFIQLHCKKRKQVLEYTNGAMEIETNGKNSTSNEDFSISE